MRDDPFLAVLEAPEFGAGEVEAAPPDPPFFGLVGTIGFGDEGFELIGVLVHEGEPGFRSFF